ncbi:16S rRNA (guanine(527)-N(7))-methyltransferase RsmG [Pseudoroseomonas wenyumeiae]|uniref:Ribosomal RNA small subunit methyltransferase G n=2 Tax=Teichococcus wenyumeiae TaxID=2478470 RepID=A0A3A9JCG2_9PROT|nr:16S rRNA (guanine(527)-N(7))-methyltransferase RsmG [Pseudoroseomonas wenyumeiae]RKK02393.1 16S rRNA (guanine(527)-N(7))-methyltransferase RsmG [Pseudoroseomonas wenyumeiae]RMI27403.1 16S rRNA (guanine(527)-N(7))-methyltransferase RsmG [Pseudoroseomonas wenyumeiae]
MEALPPAVVSRETEARIEAFVPLLLRWNARINLIGPMTEAVVRQRHVADSLQLLPLVPPGEGPLGDLGSGGGFPGLVLAMALERPVHLVESDRRKAAFLQTAAADLGLRHVQVHIDRIEAVTLPPLAVLTARALASLEKMLPWAERLLAPDGVAIFPKGRTALEEMQAAAPGWTMSAERFKSSTDADASIFRLSRIRRAGA